jgi:hypothetical protein
MIGIFIMEAPNTELFKQKTNSRKLIYNKVITSESIILEVGVWEGANAELMYTYGPKALYLIDAWENQSNNELYKLEKGRLPQNIFDKAYNTVKNKFNRYENVKIIKGYSSDLVNTFKDEFFDMIYIDAAHYYEAVKEDFENWFPKVKVGGYICGDDYMIKEAHKFGVIPAIDEFKTFPLPGCGQFCLRKVKA